MPVSPSQEFFFSCTSPNDAIFDVCIATKPVAEKTN